jgi:hypothetical protein
MGRAERFSSTVRRVFASAFVASTVFVASGCGAKPTDDAPALGTATAIPVGAPGAVGVAIPASLIGVHAADPTDGSKVEEAPKAVPKAPFAPEEPMPVQPVPSSKPHGGTPKKTPSKGLPI